MILNDSGWIRSISKGTEGEESKKDGRHDETLTEKKKEGN